MIGCWLRLRARATLVQTSRQAALGLRSRMPASFIKNPAHWRQRAEEDPQSKDAMLRIAKDYERLAERAEQRGKGSGPAT